MAGDRNVKVTLSAQVQGFIDGMARAAKATKEVGSESEKLAQQREAFNKIGAAALGMGTMAAAGSALAIKKWADYDAAMSNVQAATGESKEMMDALSEAALDAGARTVYSAEESANAIEELAKAGVSTADILNGALDGALDLAAAGGLGVADAAGIAATALQTFKLEGSDMAHVADLLAAGAGKAMGDVTDLSGALNQSSMVASATGLSIEETTGSLAAFASQGLLGSDAGTSFKSMLQSLTPSSAAARDKMNELGISAYDAQGNFIGMAEFAGVLQNGLKNLSVEQQQAALKTIFGSDAIRAATVLYSEGEEGIQGWIDAVDDQGYAAEQAAMRLDNLKGDLEGLGGALDTALIETGSAGNDVLRGMVQAVTEAIDAYNELPAPLQGAILWGGILTAGVGLLSGAFFVGVPKLAAYRANLELLGPAAQRTARGVAAATRAVSGLAVVGAVSFGIDSLANSFNEKLSPAAEETTNRVLTAQSAVEAFAGVLDARLPGSSDKIGLARTQVEGLGAALDDASDSNFWAPMTAGSEELLVSWRMIGDELAATDFDSAVAQFARITDEANLTDEQIAELIKQSPAWEGALTKQATQMDIAGDEATILKLALGELTPATDGASVATNTAAESLLAEADAAAAAKDELQQLIDVINEANGVGQDAYSANIAYQDALAGVDTHIQNARNGLEGFTIGLDQTTQSGRDNMRMIVDLAGDYQNAAAKQYELDGNTENYVANLQAGRDAVLTRARDLGATDEQIQQLSEHIVAMPEEKQVKVLVETEEAEAKLAEVTRVRDALIRVRTEGGAGSGALNWNPSGTVDNANGGVYQNGVKAFADGGFEPGIYPYTQGGIHKFAEAYGEAYISMDPARADRSRQVWIEAGNRLGATQDMVRSIVAELGGTGRGAVVNQTINAQPGMSESDIARIAAEKINRSYRNA